ncbi:phosphatase PAP2 family protein [Streptomyces apocyni]|uniref:phosphatase PAP2 family protein n=1 Tax=Streptomyces apocyni TaxID=2654677 RepID=UPI001E5767CA|nr:phosphatase PAP2 family protein [Streptomyces apocyni]
MLCGVLLGWLVAFDGPVRRLDERVGLAVGRDQVRERPEGVARLLADLGEVMVAVPVLVAVLAFVGWRAWRRGAARWWVAPGVGALVMAAVPLVVVPAKMLVGRAGPPGMTSAEGFYPSGHATTAAVAYGAAALLVLPYLRAVWSRRVVTVSSLLVVVAVGVGLVRCGYHWPLDVVGGWCLGTALVAPLWVLRQRPGGSASGP